jgi:hypothetical protein
MDVENEPHEEEEEDEEEEQDMYDDEYIARDKKSKASGMHRRHMEARKRNKEDQEQELFIEIQQEDE